MTTTATIVAFLLIWWIVFFAALPWGIRRLPDEGKGHDPGAPIHPHLWRKALAATLIACGMVGGLWWAVERDYLRMIFFE
jgi:predicted secreted protein